MATEPFNPLAVNADRGALATKADLYRVALIQVGATVAILTALRFLPI